MKKQKEQHSRGELLYRKTKVLCHNGHGIQVVTDAFNQPDGVLLALECGCRRSEKAS